MPAHTNPDESGTIGDGKPQADTETSAAANEVDGAYADGPALPRTNKVVLVMDLVESVRLMAQDESGVVARWHGFTKKASKLIPRHRGRIVKSLGDGLLAEFDHSRDAVQVATALHKMIQPANQGRGQDQQLWLRVGINATPVYVDAIDIYGSGVNLAARLAGLAGPGETIASASVRDQLTDGLDADVEDMGECYLKHVEEPVRAYRIGPPGPRPVLVPEREYIENLRLSIAVVPFESKSKAVDFYSVGELIVDGVIAQLGRTRELNVISRFASTSFREREDTKLDISQILGVRYVLTGSYLSTGSATNSNLLVTFELFDNASKQILFTNRIEGQVADLLQLNSELTQRIADDAHKALMNAEVNATFYKPLPSLASQTLYFSGVGSVHHSNLANFVKSEQALSTLMERHPRHAEVIAWLAKWHAIRVNRGLSSNPAQDRMIATDLASRAIDLSPNSAFALSVAGLVRSFFHKDLDGAASLYEQAIELNPNEPLAWLYLGTLNSWQGNGEAAAEFASRALALVPLGPMKYYIASLAALPLIVAGRYQEAIQLLHSSIKVNKLHSASYRALAAASALSGHMEEARDAGRRVLQLEPNFTVKEFLNRYAGSAHSHSQNLAHALELAGIPKF